MRSEFISKFAIIKVININVNYHWLLLIPCFISTFYSHVFYANIFKSFKDEKIRRWGNAHIVRRFILVGSPLTYVCLNDNYHSIFEDSDNRVRCQSEILLSSFISSQVLINRQPYIAYVIIFQMLFIQ